MHSCVAFDIEKQVLFWRQVPSSYSSIACWDLWGCRVTGIPTETQSSSLCEKNGFQGKTWVHGPFLWLTVGTSEKQIPWMSHFFPCSRSEHRVQEKKDAAVVNSKQLAGGNRHVQDEAYRD